MFRCFYEKINMDFKNKKVVIMGLGLYAKGSGISAAKFFISRGAKVVITDLKSKKELSGQIESVLKFYAAVKKNSPPKADPPLAEKFQIHKPVFVLGRHREADFKTADIVMKNPAVRAGSPFLRVARRHGAKILTDVSLFFRICACPIIGITGTRGKSTTTTLVYEILRSAGWNAYLGGNIQISPLTFLDKVENNILPLILPFRVGEEWKGGEGLSAVDKTPSRSPLMRGRKLVVLELSSWMLESTGEAKISPRAALITNMMPDHLNTYAGMSDYIAAKKNIFRFQRAGDIAVYNYDNEITRKMGEEARPPKFCEAKLWRARAKRFWFGKTIKGDGVFIKNGAIFFRRGGRRQKICSISDIKLAGEHNLYNIMAAAALTAAVGVAPEAIRKAIKNFRGIPNRLELIREHRGIKFYNDTTATTPDAVIAALRAIFPPLIKGRRGGVEKKIRGKIILIAGGSDKNLEFAEMARELKKQKVRLILFAGKATEKLIVELDKIHYHAESQPVRDMKSAVGLARSLAVKGDIILLSPGAASFGLFQNEFDRGRQFVKMIKRLR